MHARILLTLTLAGLTLTTARAADDKALKLRWFGQSFFQVETSAGTRIVFDPHAIDIFGRTSVEADIVLMSHLHTDHMVVDVLANPGKFKAIAGLTGTNRRSAFAKIDEKFKDGRIRSVPSYHDESEGMERGKNTIFVVEADGLRIAHLGDLGHTLSPAQIKAIGPVDILLVPVGGIYTLNGGDAKKVMAQLKPRLYTLPMHYGVKGFSEVLPLDEFLDETENVEKMEKTNELVIPVNAKADKMKVIVLGWTKDGK